MIHEQFRAYRATLQDDRRHLLERFEVVDVARKVVGVGSVGTRAFIVLLQGRDQDDPLFLQVKEATASVLEDHLPKSRYRQPGERVVQGQRMMQAASDIFLGWTKGAEANRYLYWRQLRDMKGSAVVEAMVPAGAHVLRAQSAAGPWRGRTPDPATRSRSPRTSARRTSSTSRSPTSPNATPTRTSRTTRRSPPRSDPAGWRRSRASKETPSPLSGKLNKGDHCVARTWTDRAHHLDCDRILAGEGSRTKGAQLLRILLSQPLVLPSRTHHGVHGRGPLCGRGLLLNPHRINVADSGWTVRRNAPS